MQVSLQVSHNKANVRRVVVTHDAVIGRGSECNLRIAAQHVSRQHCRLILAENGVFVRDLGSSNGTFVQGERIAINEDIYIEPGSELSVGGVKFVVDYTLDDQVPAEAVADAADVADDADIEPADQVADPNERTLDQFGEWAGETVEEELADAPAEAVGEPVELHEVADEAVPVDAADEAVEDVYDAVPVDDADEVVEVVDGEIVEVAEALDDEVVEVVADEVVEEVYEAVPVDEVDEVEEAAEIVEVVEEVPVEVAAEVSEDDIADFLAEPVVKAPPPPKPAPAAKSAPVGKSRPAPAAAPAARGKRKGPGAANEIVEEESLSDFLKKLGD